MIIPPRQGSCDVDLPGSRPDDPSHAAVVKPKFSVALEYSSANWLRKMPSDCWRKWNHEGKAVRSQVRRYPIRSGAVSFLKVDYRLIDALNNLGHFVIVQPLGSVASDVVGLISIERGVGYHYGWEAVVPVV